MKPSCAYSRQDDSLTDHKRKEGVEEILGKMSEDRFHKVSLQHDVNPRASAHVQRALWLLDRDQVVLHGVGMFMLIVDPLMNPPFAANPHPPALLRSFAIFCDAPVVVALRMSKASRQRSLPPLCCQ